MLVSDRQLLSSLNLLLDLILELCHVEHELIDLARPHGELLSLEVLPEDFLISIDSLLAPVVGDISPVPEEPGETVSVDSIPGVGGNSLLLLLSLVVSFPEAETGALESKAVLQVEEPLDATVVLVLHLLKVEDL